MFGCTYISLYLYENVGHKLLTVEPSSLLVVTSLGVQGRSLLLLGIDRLGRVQSCRPLSVSSNDNSFFLDNYSCRILMKRGQFEFSPFAQPFQGLHYMVQRMAWVMPQME